MANSFPKRFNTSVLNSSACPTDHVVSQTTLDAELNTVKSAILADATAFSGLSLQYNHPTDGLKTLVLYPEATVAFSIVTFVAELQKVATKARFPISKISHDNMPVPGPRSPRERYPKRTGMTSSIVRRSRAVREALRGSATATGTATTPASVRPHSSVTGSVDAPSGGTEQLTRTVDPSRVPLPTDDETSMSSQSPEADRAEMPDNGENLAPMESRVGGATSETQPALSNRPKPKALGTCSENSAVPAPSVPPSSSPIPLSPPLVPERAESPPASRPDQSTPQVIDLTQSPSSTISIVSTSSSVQIIE